MLNCMTCHIHIIYKLQIHIFLKYHIIVWQFWVLVVGSQVVAAKMVLAGAPWLTLLVQGGCTYQQRKFQHHHWGYRFIGVSTLGEDSRV